MIEPRWNGALHALYWCGRQAKRFVKDAPKQERLLEEFERKRWKECISLGADCLAEIGGKAALRNTVRNLNRSLRGCLRFHQEGTGSRLRWEPAVELPNCYPNATLDTATRHGEDFFV